MKASPTSVTSMGGSLPFSRATYWLFRSLGRIVSRVAAVPSPLGSFGFAGFSRAALSCGVFHLIDQAAHHDRQLAAGDPARWFGLGGFDPGIGRFPRLAVADGRQAAGRRLLVRLGLARNVSFSSSASAP